MGTWCRFLRGKATGGVWDAELNTHLCLMPRPREGGDTAFIACIGTNLPFNSSLWAAFSFILNYLLYTNSFLHFAFLDNTIIFVILLLPT